jgi:prepilin-type processing-associated H-X9-DG protein
VQRVHDAASRAISTNNLKQLALAMHNYHDATGAFPPGAIYSKDGKPQLSWRVLLLPYLDEEGLYKEFKLDEPWDSEHNKKLLEKMPRVFAANGKPDKKGLTHYQAFTGKGMLFDGVRGSRIANVTDGTSNTLMFVEAAQAVPWTKPDDLPYDPDKPLPKLGGLFKGGFNAAFCDGSVRFISETIAEKTLRALITPNGGEVIRDDF